MGMCVCGGAMLMCSLGMTPSVLNVLPTARVMNSMALASVMDHIPMCNIMPFGMCSSLANPMVAAATAAAMGVLTPMPCIPVIPAIWTPGNPQILIGGKPALTSDSMLMCAYGGVIKVSFPGTVNILL